MHCNPGGHSFFFFFFFSFFFFPVSRWCATLPDFGCDGLANWSLSRPVARIDGGVQDPQNVDLWAQKVHFLNLTPCNSPIPGGTDLERGYGDVRPWRPPFHASPAARKGPISSKRVSSQDLLLRKFGNFSLNSLNFHPNFSSQAPKFGNFPLTSLQMQMSVRKPHTSEIRAAHPYLKKSWVLPPPGLWYKNPWVTLAHFVIKKDLLADGGGGYVAPPHPSGYGPVFEGSRTVNSVKFSNLRAGELKFGQKLRQLKSPFFPQNRVSWTDF